VDRESALLDGTAANNYWTPRVLCGFAWLYTPLEETDLTNDYDRWNILFGPWLYGPPYADAWYSRATVAGFRVGAYRTQQFNGGVFAGYRTDFRDFVVGAAALVDHFPLPHAQVGFNLDKPIRPPGVQEVPAPGNQAALFAPAV